MNQYKPDNQVIVTAAQPFHRCQCNCSNHTSDPAKDAEMMRDMAKRIERHSSGLAKALRESAELAEKMGEVAQI